MKIYVCLALAILTLTSAACAPKSRGIDPRTTAVPPKGGIPDDVPPVVVPPPAPPTVPPTEPPVVTYDNWFTKDLEVDSIPGTSADRAYTLSFVRTGVTPVIVSVIDSGVDISHEDLKTKLWQNEAEANGQAGVDDDNNGFVDDINGWNFLGSIKEGQAVHITNERLELTRELVRMKKLKQDREANGETLTPEEQAYLDKVTEDHTTQYTETKNELEELTTLKANILENAQKIASLRNTDLSTLTAQQAKDAAVTTPEEQTAKDALVALFTTSGFSGVARISRFIEVDKGTLAHYLNESFNPRAEIIGDATDDYTDRNYGNSVVEGPLDEEGIASGADHGTHVAGIIGADRTNSIGIKGIAEDVRFMSLRAVPDGDEYDKDVANSVRYSVDNGAKILNMSFGKSYSPGKKAVDAAFEYAASKNVLIVHAAGNSNLDIDVAANFPNKKSSSGSLIPGWLEIGASSKDFNEMLPAVFSNFGQTAVDLFAQGVALWSSVPGNTYLAYSGTSMASPSAAGVAALLWSQFPTLTAMEVKLIIEKTATDAKDLDVKKPGTSDIVKFALLSRIGGIANAYNALIEACTYTGGTNCTR